MEVTKWDLFKQIEQIPEEKYWDIYDHLYKVIGEDLADPYELCCEEEHSDNPFDRPEEKDDNDFMFEDYLD